MHLIFKPLPRVLLTIRPVVLALATDLVFVEFTLIVTFLREHKFASAVLPSLVILALVPGAVRPALLTETVLLVFKPLSFVLSAVHVSVGALSVCLVIQPVTLVGVSIRMIELAIARRAILFIVAFVARAVGPLLDTEAVSSLADPLSSVNPTIRECDSWFFYAWGFVHADLLLSLLFKCAVGLKIIIEHSLIRHFK